MKKLWIVAFLALMMSLQSCSFSLNRIESPTSDVQDSRSEQGQSSSADDFQTSMEALDGSTVAFGTATRIAISNKTVGGEKKYYLTFLDDSDDVGDVTFRKGGKVFTRKEIKAQADKVLVTSDYIFIRFTKNKILYTDRMKDADYDRKNYDCDGNSHSFVLVKASGRVYSLQEQPKIDKIVGQKAVVGNKIYTMKIENEKVVFEQISPDTVKIFDFFYDAFGQYFLFNDCFDGKSGDVLFINTTSYQNKDLIFCLGEGIYLSTYGNMAYTVNQKNGEVAQYVKNGARASFGNNQNTYTFHSVKGAYEKDISYLFKNEYIFKCESGSDIKVSKLKNAEGYKKIIPVTGQVFVIKNYIFKFTDGDVYRTDGAYYGAYQDLSFTKIYTEGEAIINCGDSFMVLEKGEYYKYDPYNKSWVRALDNPSDLFISRLIPLNL